MSKRILPVVIVCVVLVIAALPVTAQETLTYDEPVIGELTAEVGAVEYVFEGTAGDVLFIIYQPVDILDDLDRPKLLLTAPDGTELVVIDTYGTVEAAAWLPVDGQYNIVATREDEASVGEFSLAVYFVPGMVPGKTYTTAIDNDEVGFFYVAGGQPFILDYDKLSGDFYPALSANIIRDDYNPGSLDYVAQLQGAEVERGMLYVNGQSDLYIITLDEPLFEVNFSTVEGEYAVTLQLVEE